MSLETSIPDLLQSFGSELTEARLDILAWSAARLPTLLCDVTVRHPWANRYAAQSARIPGYASARADDSKIQRYGYSVSPCSVESYGRIGHDFENLLQTLASYARTTQRLQGLPPGQHLPRWRLLLSYALNPPTPPISAVINHMLHQ